jgi:two-component system NtrC family response regulator
MLGESILVVDDDIASARYISLALQQGSHEVRIANNGIEAQLAIEHEVPGLVITDLQMPGMDGLELLARIKERWPEVAVMLVTVEEDVATVVQAVQRGAVNYLIKPVAPAVLQTAAANALSRRTRAMPSPGDGHAPEIIGISPTILQVRHLVVLASRSDANVVITGGTGTGKELVARAIHRLSGDPPCPFVPHNCALTPADLFDSEFFGHRRGAFTGADRDRVGLLRQADGGILLLDELECLNLANQAKLLRVLDDGQIRALGSEESRSISVRFLAATNRSPQSMFATGDLREDLYYRLRGFQIDLPLLCDRTEDIPLLAKHYLKDRNKCLTPAALAALEACAWPGNVRQLRTVLACACATASGIEIDKRDLDLGPAGIRRPELPVERLSRELNLQELERRAIVAVLAENGGSRKLAAKTLGIHRSTLRRKLRELGIEPGGTGSGRS